MGLGLLKEVHITHFETRNILRQGSVHRGPPLLGVACILYRPSLQRCDNISGCDSAIWVHEAQQLVADIDDMLCKYAAAFFHLCSALVHVTEL